METLFDHEPNDEELQFLFLAGQNREKYLETIRDQETEFGNIYALYMIRGNRDKAMEYLGKIRNPKEHFNSKKGGTAR